MRVSFAKYGHQRRVENGFVEGEETADYGMFEDIIFYWQDVKNERHLAEST